MGVALRVKRGQTAVIGQMTRKEGELTYDTQTKKLYVHDGVTVGGVDVSGMTDAQISALIASSVAGKINTADLLANGQIKSAYLPSYVDDVLEASSYSALPTTGETGKIYVTLDTNNEYRWSGSQYIQLTASPGTTDAVPEGTTNKYFTAARVLSAVLSGLSVATGGAIVSTDNVIGAFGKLQAQLTQISQTIAGYGTAAAYSVISSVFDATPNRVLLTGAGGLLGVCQSFTGNIDDPAAVPLGKCFMTNVATGTKPCPYGILESTNAVGNQGMWQTLREITGTLNVTYRTWERCQYGTTTTAWGPWRLVIKQGDIVGTVSNDSAGVANGGVLQRGSNANGVFTKYADGSMECFKVISVSSLAMQASGSGYSSVASQAAQAFAATFARVDNFNIEVVSSDAVCWAGCVAGPTTSAWPAWYLSSLQSGSKNATLYFRATGVWFI